LAKVIGLEFLRKKMLNKQEKIWKNTFGDGYTERNALNILSFEQLYHQRYGKTRRSLNEDFIGNLDRSSKILEVGSNVGNQLLILRKMGFSNLFGIDINQSALELAKQRNLTVIYGSVLDIPFRDNFFDLIFTSGLLIHIPLEEIHRAISEIYRCTNQYIWGLEYYADKFTEIKYRGHSDLLWKANFSQLYFDSFSNLELIREKQLKYLNGENEDRMFLLKKRR